MKKEKSDYYNLEIEFNIYEKDGGLGGSETMWISFWAKNMKTAKKKSRVFFKALEENGYDINEYNCILDNCKVSKQVNTLESFRFD